MKRSLLQEYLVGFLLLVLRLCVSCEQASEDMGLKDLRKSELAIFQRCSAIPGSTYPVERVHCFNE